MILGHYIIGNERYNIPLPLSERFRMKFQVWDQNFQQFQQFSKFSNIFCEIPRKIHQDRPKIRRRLLKNNQILPKKLQICEKV